MDKTYVITGSASGIGKALLQEIAKDNLVFAGYRNPKHEDALKSISQNVYPFYVDYTQPDTIKSAAETILAQTSRIDTLVNIAGCVVAGPVECIDINEIRKQFDVNVFGHIDLTQRLLPAMENSRIINVSSMASFGIFPFISPYCASKRCLDMFFNALLIENKKNIRVVSVKPGVITTPLWEKSIEENSKYFERFGEYSKEMQYVLENAKKNETNGLSVDKVVKVILNADRAKNPKLSYTVGGDAFAAHLVSKLPQCIINKLIKTGIKLRIK